MSETGRQVGYMNAHHQRIISRAKVLGDPAICFVMWCSQCGHHYVADDGDVEQRRCPHHDNGWPAINADNRFVQWVT